MEARLTGSFGGNLEEGNRWRYMRRDPKSRDIGSRSYSSRLDLFRYYESIPKLRK